MSDTLTPTPLRAAYHASLDGVHGVIAKPGSAIVFLRDDGAMHVLTTAELANIVVLGEVATALYQYLEDQLRGGAAAIACTRRQEVQ